MLELNTELYIFRRGFTYRSASLLGTLGMDRGQSPLALSANAAQFLVLAGLPAVLLEAWLELTCSKLWVLAEVAFLRLRVAEYTSRIALESVAPSSC